MHLFLLLRSHGTDTPNTTFCVGIAVSATTDTSRIPFCASAVRFSNRANSVIITAFTSTCASCNSLILAASGIVAISTTRIARISANITPALGLIVFPDAFPFFTTLVTVRVVVGPPVVALALTLLSGAPFSSVNNSIILSVAAPVDDPVDSATTAVDGPVNIVTTVVDGPVDSATTPVNDVVDPATAAVDSIVNIVTTAVDGPIDIVTTAVLIATGFSVGKRIVEIGALLGSGRLAGNNGSRLLLRNAA